MALSDKDKQDMERILSPLDKSIGRLQEYFEPKGIVHEISTEQARQSDRIETLTTSVDTLEAKFASGLTSVNKAISEMPAKWNADIDTKVGKCQKERNDVSGMIDTATEKGRAEAERQAAAVRGRHSNSPAKHSGAGQLVSKAFEVLWRPILVLAAIGLLALMGLFGYRNGDPADEAEQINQRLESFERLLGDVAKAAENAPEATFQPPTEEPTSNMHDDHLAGSN